MAGTVHVTPLSPTASICTFSFVATVHNRLDVACIKTVPTIPQSGIKLYDPLPILLISFNSFESIEYPKPNVLIIHGIPCLSFQISNIGISPLGGDILG